MMHDSKLLRIMGTDGRKWAEEFCKRFGEDEELMTVWFSNAIEAGKEWGYDEYYTGP